MTNTPYVEIHSDGSYSRKHDIGGWCALVKWAYDSMMLYGNERHTTNNRMELMGPIQALLQLQVPCRVLIYTDSQYVVGGWSKGWINKWKSNGWVTALGKPVKNQDLWQWLDFLCQRHMVDFQWVKGHAGNVPNEVCDQVSRHFSHKLLKGHGYAYPH